MATNIRTSSLVPTSSPETVIISDESTDAKLIQYPRWIGGSASCMAVALSHPLDLIKVRMQTAPPDMKKGPIATVASILKSEGPKGFYNGLSAGFLRQATYGFTRFAVYEELKQRAYKQNAPPSVTFLILSATFSGFCGGIVGNPADIANVRMQNEKSLPPHLRKNYRNVFDVLIRIGREEGFAGYLRGLWPNCIRAAGMTGAQLGSYDAFKKLFINQLGMRDDVTTQGVSSLMSGFVATTICNPIDVIKTQTMSSSGRQISLLGAIKSLTKSEGASWMFRGWLPSFARLGPHTMATLMLLEQHRAFYRWYNQQ